MLLFGSKRMEVMEVWRLLVYF